jgi:hypothetical protein
MPRRKDLEGLIAHSMLLAHAGHLHAAEDQLRALKRQFTVAEEVDEKLAQAPEVFRALMVPDA